jgi:hypothetical protein
MNMPPLRGWFDPSGKIREFLGGGDDGDWKGDRAPKAR